MALRKKELGALGMHVRQPSLTVLPTAILESQQSLLEIIQTQAFITHLHEL